VAIPNDRHLYYVMALGGALVRVTVGEMPNTLGVRRSPRGGDRPARKDGQDGPPTDGGGANGSAR